MISITKSTTISSSLDKVWNVLVNLDEQKYWTGMRKIKILSSDGNTIEREATVGFLNSKSRQTLVRDPKKSIKITMTKGPMLGKREIVLTPMDEDSTRVDLSWEFELKGVPNFAKGYVEDHIREGTDKALEGIAEEARRTIVDPKVVTEV
jgi:hypothetical protein